MLKHKTYVFKAIKKENTKDMRHYHPIQAIKRSDVGYLLTIVFIYLTLSCMEKNGPDKIWRLSIPEV